MGRPPSQPFASDLKGAWLELFGHVQNRHDRHHLRGFMGHLCHVDVGPAAAANDHLDAYMAEAEVRRRVKRITQFRRDIATSWNRMVDAIGGWPRNRLTVVDSLGPRSLSLDELPLSFGAEVREYLDSQPAIDDLFSESTHKGFADATKSALLTRTILGHSSIDVTNDHYNQAQMIESSRHYADVVETLRQRFDGAN